MGCLTDTIKNKVVKNATSYTVTKDKVFIPVTEKRDLSSTYKIADSKVKSLNKEFNSEKFGDVVSLDSSTTNGTGINIHPSKVLDAAYEVKSGSATIDKVQDVFIQEGNQYFTDGEVYPTYEDAVQQKVALGEASSKEVLEPILNRLKNRFDIEYEFIEDENAPAGEFDFESNQVKINLNKARLDTPFHEFAHPFIRVARMNNRELYNSLVKEINSSKEGQATLKEVREKYKDISETGQIEEAIVTLIGLHASNNIKDKSLIDKLKDFINSIIERLGLSINPSTLSNMSIKELGQLMVSSKRIDVSKSGVYEGIKTSASILNSKKSKKKEKIERPAFQKQFTFLTRRVNTFEKRLTEEKNKSSKRALEIQKELREIKNKLAKAQSEQSLDLFKELGEHMLDRAESYIESLEIDSSSVSEKNLNFTKEAIESFRKLKGLEVRTSELLDRLYPFNSERVNSIINDFSTEKYIKGKEDFIVTDKMIDGQNVDINIYRKTVGALSDLSNYIGRTIGSLIKASQNKASINNKKIKTLVEVQVKKLEKYSEDNNLSMEEVYDMFIDEGSIDINLVSVYKEGKLNPKYTELKKKGNESLWEFYNFYKDLMTKSEANLPYKVGKLHIPNISKDDLKTTLKTLFKEETILNDKFVGEEELHADIVPYMYRGQMDKTKKSRDLGTSLLSFAAYSNFHNELSEVLPKVRLLQERILYEKNERGDIIKRTYLKSSDPATKIDAEETNLYKMVSDVIDMQVKGKMTKDNMTPFKTEEVHNEKGEVVGYKQIKPERIVDKMLRYNSLLRIGFSPVTASVNVLFGDLANIIESVGGLHFNFKNLKDATSIFNKQISYLPDTDKNTPIYEWLEKLNPLQELDDYNLADDIIIKKMSKEKFLEYAYSMQKKGELFLQSRTMLAVLIKDGYMTPKGETTQKGKDISEDEARRLSDKVQRLNQYIHGRYSQREAATAQQNVWFRAAIQFRKWIPAALEARFGEKTYDNRLGVEIEGRYVTAWNLLASKDVLDNLGKMAKGELSPTEMYNMKKNLIELTLMFASFALYALLHGGDDDEDKEMRKNFFVKTTLTMLDRIAGDLEFFYNPANAVNLAKNAIPMAKTASDLIKTIKYAEYALYMGDWEYKRGSLKGSNKFYANVSKVLIGAKPIQDVQKLLNDNPYGY